MSGMRDWMEENPQYQDALRAYFRERARRQQAQVDKLREDAGLPKRGRGRPKKGSLEAVATPTVGKPLAAARKRLKAQEAEKAAVAAL